MNTLNVLFVVLILKAIVALPPPQAAPDASKDEKDESEIAPREEPKAHEKTSPGTAPSEDPKTPPKEIAPREEPKAHEKTSPGTAPSEDPKTPPKDKDVSEIPNVKLHTKKSCQCFIDSLPKDKTTTCPGDDKKETDEYKKNKEFCEEFMKKYFEDTAAATPDTTELPSLKDASSKICPKYINKTESTLSIEQKESKLLCGAIARDYKEQNETTAATTTTPSTTDTTEQPKEDIYSFAEIICPCYDTKYNSTNCTIPADEIQTNTTSYNHTKKFCELEFSKKDEEANIPTENPLNNTTASNDANPWSGALSFYRDICPCFDVSELKDVNKTATCNNYTEEVAANSTTHTYKETTILCEAMQNFFEKRDPEENKTTVNPASTIKVASPTAPDFPNTRSPSSGPETVTVSSKQETPSKGKSYSLATVLGWSFGSVVIGVGVAMVGFLLYKRFKTSY